VNARRRACPRPLNLAKIRWNVRKHCQRLGATQRLAWTIFKTGRGNITKATVIVVSMACPLLAYSERLPPSD
jgi:hypothetical protein